MTIEVLATARIAKRDRSLRRARLRAAGIALCAFLASCTAAGGIGGTAIPVREESVNTIATNGELGMWPGGVARLADGRYYLVYERMAPNAQSFGRIMDHPLGAAGPEEYIAGFFRSDDHKQGAFDPGVAVTDEGNLLISWSSHREGVFLLERTPEGDFSRMHQLAPKHHTGVTLQNVGERIFASYNYVRPGSDWVGAHYDNDVIVQELHSATEWEEQVVAGRPSGSGTDGNHMRNNVSWTGNRSGPDELIVVWGRPSSPPGGDRTIWAALSPDGGETWGPGFEIAAVEGDDLANPFAIWVDFAQELRVYFVNHLGEGGTQLSVVSSSDHGRSWSDVSEVPHPEGTKPAPGRPIMLELDGRVISFGSWIADGERVLASYSLP